MPNFDPSKMDPKLLMELSKLIQELPPDKLNRMQTLMHNMMAGLDVSKEMEEFERTLPPGFRERLFGIMMSPAGANFMANSQSPTSSPHQSAPPYQSTISPINSAYSPQQSSENTEVSSGDMNLREARLTVLKAVASGTMSPEEAERVLFPQ